MTKRKTNLIQKDPTPTKKTNHPINYGPIT